MLTCWESVSASRPEFQNIINTLLDLLHGDEDDQDLYENYVAQQNMGFQPDALYGNVDVQCPPVPKRN